MLASGEKYILLLCAWKVGSLKSSHICVCIVKDLKEEYHRAPCFQGLYTNFASGAKGSSWKLFSQNNIGSTLYNTCELTCDGVSVNFQ